MQKPKAEGDKGCYLMGRAEGPFRPPRHLGGGKEENARIRSKGGYAAERGGETIQGYLLIL